MSFHIPARLLMEGEFRHTACHPEEREDPAVFLFPKEREYENDWDSSTLQGAVHSVMIGAGLSGLAVGFSR